MGLGQCSGVAEDNVSREVPAGDEEETHRWSWARGTSRSSWLEHVGRRDLQVRPSISATSLNRRRQSSDEPWAPVSTRAAAAEPKPRPGAPAPTRSSSALASRSGSEHPLRTCPRSEKQKFNSQKTTLWPPETQRLVTPMCIDLSRISSLRCNVLKIKD